MSTGDFSVKSSATGNNLPVSPLVTLGAVSEISVEDLEGVLDIISEEIILVQRSSGKIMWVSNTCRSVAHKLGATNNIEDFPSLQRIIDDALSQDTGVKLQAKWHTRDAQWQQYIGDNRKASISVLVRPENYDHIWVRFHRTHQREDYLRQSLAEHEKLFSTSRSISVSEMVTTLAHELNQPLGTLVNIVNGIRSRLSASGKGSDDIFEALELAQKQGQFASDILLRLRDFAESKKPVIEKCNVSTLISNTLELLDWVFLAEEVNVKFSIKDTEIELFGDATLLQQVLVNLLRNSVDAMVNVENGQKRIDITVSRCVETVSISISDTGHGISDDHEETLFTPFKSKKTHGMGVGLNICRSFIELHQGKFWFSQNETCGCTANIVIPNGLSK